MKTRLIRSAKNIIGATVMVVLAFACSSQQKSAREDRERTLLGLGDSITEGGPEFFSYLFPLDSMLRNGKYRIRFTGPKQITQSGITLNHAGYSGKTAEYLAKITDSVYAAFPADIVLLHSGHNHFAEESPVEGIIQAQKKIIRTIKAKNPRAVIFVAAVITAGKLPKYEYIPALNKLIRSMVSEMNDRSIIYVDQQTNWNWQKHTIHDKVHPNREGARLIAENWYQSIIKFIKPKS